MKAKFLTFIPLLLVAYFVSVIIVSCTSNGNVNTGAQFISKEKRIESSPDSSLKVIDAEDIPLNAVSAKNTGNQKSPEFIKNRIEALIGTSVKKWTEAAGVIYPLSCVLFRAFKQEKEFEIWVDDAPGPKLAQNDLKTPEGFYTCDISNSSTNWWMWMKLTTENVDDTGEVSNGSCFKLCCNYPNQSDLARTRKYSSKKSAGGEICVHGNCVTAGCISFKNRAFLPVYLMATKHNSARYGPVPLHIFPFRFSEEMKEKFESSYPPIDSTYLRSFWNNLEEGFELFNKTHKQVKFTFTDDKYIFKK
ncbi:MAG: hypothetical protein HY738_08160 [Bacteroidia bacterium]|nr:hypothetical protein [Bacteroidia bacterium]